MSVTWTCFIADWKYDVRPRILDRWFATNTSIACPVVMYVIFYVDALYFHDFFNTIFPEIWVRIAVTENINLSEAHAYVFSQVFMHG